MFYILRDKDGKVFAGFTKTEIFGKFRPVFLKPMKGASAQANVIHADDVCEAEDDLRKSGIEVERVQVG